MPHYVWVREASCAHDKGVTLCAARAVTIAASAAPYVSSTPGRILPTVTQTHTCCICRPLRRSLLGCRRSSFTRVETVVCLRVSLLSVRTPHERKKVEKRQRSSVSESQRAVWCVYANRRGGGEQVQHMAHSRARRCARHSPCCRAHLLVFQEVSGLSLHPMSDGQYSPCVRIQKIDLAMACLHGATPSIR